MSSIQDKPYPVNEGEKINVTIVGLGVKGDGIAKIDGFVLMVPFGEKGVEYKVEVTAIRGRVGFAKVIKKIDSA